MHLALTRPLTFTPADVENVVNFDFPPTPEAYVHRVGRYVLVTVVWQLGCVIGEESYRRSMVINL